MRPPLGWGCFSYYNAYWFFENLLLRNKWTDLTVDWHKWSYSNPLPKSRSNQWNCRMPQHRQGRIFINCFLLNSEEYLDKIWHTDRYWQDWLPHPYMVKTFQKSSPLEPNDRWPPVMVWSVGIPSFCSNDDARLTFDLVVERSNSLPNALI